MISVVITGGTRGLGNGMAREFLRRGARVTICGRSAESTARAVAELAAANNLQPSAPVRIGQKMIIPGKSTASASAGGSTAAARSSSTGAPVRSDSIAASATATARMPSSAVTRASLPSAIAAT